MAREFIRLHLVPTRDRTDVLCVACNNFRADQQITLADGQPTEFGVHTKCIAVLHARRAHPGSSTED